MCHDDCPSPVRGGDALEEIQVEVPLAGGTLPATFVVPDSAPAPAVLILHDINGVNDFYRDLARRLAMAGYAALLPDLFHVYGPLPDDSREARFARMQATEQATTLSEIELAHLWLRDHELTTGANATIGFCMGGTLALLGASRYPAPAATIAYYGFPNRERTPTAPIVPIDENEVAGLESPILAFWGTEDAGVGMDNVDAYDAKLNRYGKEHEFVRYDGLPHGFLTFDESSPNFENSADSWARTLAYMEARLSGAGSSE